MKRKENRILMGFDIFQLAFKDKNLKVLTELGCDPVRVRTCLKRGRCLKDC